jgi:glycosyltransferase involved in cell wall biosynthesis
MKKNTSIYLLSGLIKSILHEMIINPVSENKLTHQLPTINPGLVSVVMPTYNNAEFLRESVEAALGQTYPEVEVVVVVDGSTDETADLLASFGNRITVCTLANSGGPSRPRNIGVAKARGEFIAFCDGDDVMAPSAVADAIQIFQDFPDVALTWADCQTINIDGKVLKQSVLLEYQDFRANLNPTFHPDVSLLEGSDIYTCLLRGLFLGISAVVVRKEILAEVGRFDESLKNSDDREMWFRIARAGFKFAFRDKVLFSYRQHPHSVSNRGYLRMPAVIANLSRQLEHLPAGENRDFVLERIMKCHLSAGWGLKDAGQYKAAEKAYRRALAHKRTWFGVRGLILSRLGRFRFPNSSASE